MAGSEIRTRDLKVMSAGRLGDASHHHVRFMFRIPQRRLRGEDRSDHVCSVPGVRHHRPRQHSHRNDEQYLRRDSGTFPFISAASHGFVVSPKLRYTDTGYGQVHNNSTTCCTTNLPHRNAIPNISTCPDVVGMWQIFVRWW